MATLPRPLGEFCLDRMVQAVEAVRERLLRATAALHDDRIAHAVIGANAVAAWVAQADPAAVRNTPNVDILIARRQLPAAVAALSRAGFERATPTECERFLDNPATSLRSAVKLYFAGEKIRPEYPRPAPDVGESEQGKNFRVILLEALVQMKLTAFRTIDKVHLRDMMDVGLVDQSWVVRFPGVFGDRLQQLIDTPDG